jgi:hypothetical protein
VTTQARTMQLPDSDAAPRRGEIRTFHLLRLDDESGVSGIGWVAEGAVFSNGWVVLVWPTGTPSLNFYASIQDVEAVHGHGGRTRIVFDRDYPSDAAAT